MDEDIYDDLWEMEWIQIPDAPYVLKFNFEDNGYKIMISDLSEIYGERLVETEVQERFCTLNPYAEMKSKVILKHVKQSLDDSLKTKLKLQCTTQAITVRLQFCVSQVFFIFDIKPELLPCEKLRTHLIAPTILAALSVHQENVLLKQKIKDMEKDKPAFNMQKMKEEHTKTFGSCKIHKRSKILVTDVLESFLNLQKTIQSCISDSKALTVDSSTHIKAASNSILHFSKSNASPLKGSVKDELCMAASLKYEDLEGNTTSTQTQESVTSNIHQQSEMPSLPLKREIEDSSKTDDDSSLQPQIHTKLKKKKCLKF